MQLHAPVRWAFVLSLVIAAVAIVTSFASMEIVSQQGFWVALLAYAVLVMASVANTSWTD